MNKNGFIGNEQPVLRPHKPTTCRNISHRRIDPADCRTCTTQRDTKTYDESPSPIVGVTTPLRPATQAPRLVSDLFTRSTADAAVLATWPVVSAAPDRDGFRPGDAQLHLSLQLQLHVISSSALSINLSINKYSTDHEWSMETGARTFLIAPWINLSIRIHDEACT